jgi:hypothetical protein
MHARLLLLVLIALAATGCKPPPEAPTDLSELSLYLFEMFDDEDPLVMQAGMVNLLAFLEDYEADVDLSVESEARDRAWSMPALTEEHWGGAPHWDGSVAEDQLPIAVAVRSAYDGATHTDLIPMVDQTPLESNSSEVYDRELLADFDDWVAGDLDKLETRNDIHRLNFLLDVNYVAWKDFRMVELPDDGGTAMVARSWTTEQYIDNDADNTLDFFSNVEVTIPSGEGTLRWNCLWGSVMFNPEIDETILANTVRNGLQEGFENTEAYLDDNAR